MTAVAHWPAGLPDRPTQTGYREQRPQKTIDASVDLGPPLTRRIATAAVLPLSVTYELTGEQVNILNDFHDNTLKDGSLLFVGIHPRTGEQERMRIQSPPVITAIGAEFLASMVLEVQI